MTIPERSIETTLTIPFHDVDSMGIVWHGHYVKYLEIARCNLLDSFAFGYKAMQASGYSWPVIDVRLRYVQPVRFEQTITIKATLAEWQNRLKIDYVIRDAHSSQRLTKGYTVQVAVSPAGELCLESPPILFEKLGVAYP